MQYGALTPFFRNHSELGNVDQYAWAWGDVVLDIVRDAIRLRYRLMPYLYAAFLAGGADRRAGAATARLRLPDDPTVRDLDDEYLLGRDLLVAPVVEPGTTSRQVYLPAGSWYDWHTGELVGGSRYVVAPTPMERIPSMPAGARSSPLAGCTAVHRRLSPRRDRAAPVRAGARRHVRLDPAGGRRAHLRIGDGALSPRR